MDPYVRMAYEHHKANRHQGQRSVSRLTSRLLKRISSIQTRCVVSSSALRMTWSPVGETTAKPKAESRDSAGACRHTSEES